MKKLILFLLLLLHFSGYPQFITVCSWNLKDFGKSKNDTEIAFIAKTIRQFDVIAIQEVVAGHGGAQAIARLINELNNTGFKWDYTISEPTTGSKNSSERYAFIWKTSKLKKIGEAWLDQNFAELIDREPFYLKLTQGNQTFILANFHAVPKSKKPEKEIKYFKSIASNSTFRNVIFCGDFNLSPSHTVFNPLRSMGYRSSLTHQKTSLRQKCLGNDCLAAEYDTFFYPNPTIQKLESGIIPFYQEFRFLKEARLISDHLPIYMKFNCK